VAATAVEAPVSSLAVPLDSYVTKGQIIGETASSTLPGQAGQRGESILLPSDARAAIARAQEDVRQAETALEAARASEDAAEVQEVSTKAAERVAEQSLENERFRTDEVSEYRRDQSVLAVDQAAAAVESTRSEAKADNTAVNEATMRLDEARSTLAEAERQQELALAARDGRRTSGQVAVAAPADGLLVDQDWVAGTLGISSDPSALRVEMRMRANDLFKLRVGQPAWVSLDAKPRVTLHATVSEIAEAPIDSPSGTLYPVTLAVDNPRGFVLAGVKVHVRTTGAEANAR
jgi:multidrug resistance efflux pump